MKIINWNTFWTKLGLGVTFLWISYSGLGFASVLVYLTWIGFSLSLPSKFVAVGILFAVCYALGSIVRDWIRI